MIRAEGVTVRFRRGPFRKDILALDGFCLDVRRGDIFALIGPNGAGKSTAMYCFLGLIRPERGEIAVAGKKPEPGSSAFERIAYLPEEPHYHLYLTVEEAVRYYGSLYRRRIPDSAVREALDRVGLGEFRDLKLGKCSKGMKQKAGIAACLLNDPEILFLDEPTRGLDPVIVKEFRDILSEMNRRGTTLLINSHMLSEVELLCNRVAVIDRGKVVAQDALENLVRRDPHRYAVEIDGTDDVPDFFSGVSRQPGGTVRGEIPEASLADFFAFCTARDITVRECSLKRQSLEEAFLGILREGRRDA